MKTGLSGGITLKKWIAVAEQTEMFGLIRTKGNSPPFPNPHQSTEPLGSCAKRFCFCLGPPRGSVAALRRPGSTPGPVGDAVESERGTNCARSHQPIRPTSERCGGTPGGVTLIAASLLLLTAEKFGITGQNIEFGHFRIVEPPESE